MNNFSYPQYGLGYSWNPQAQQPKIPTMNQLMTDDERKLIESQGSGLNVERTPLDQARSKCTHKHPSHGLTIFEHKDGSGLWECTQCHKVFNIKDWSKDEVMQLVMEMTDVIDNIKLFIPYIAPQTGTSLYMAYDMIETIPQLYKYALEYKKKMWGALDAAHNPLRPDQQMNTLNMFNAIQNGGMPYYGNNYGYGGVPMPNAQNGYSVPPAPPMMQGGYPMAPNAYQDMQQQPQMNPMGFPPQQPVNPMGGFPPQSQMNPMGFPQQPQQPMGGMAIPPQNPLMNPGYPVPGMFQDRPVGVVDPSAVPGAPNPMGFPQQPQQTVVQNQVASAGPTPLANTQANVPPASIPVTTSDVKKSFKA